MEKSFRKIPVVIAAALLLCGCRPNKNGFMFNAGSLPDQVVKKFSLDKYGVAGRQWNFQALRANVYEKRGRIDAVNVRMKFFENGAESSMISADKAAMDINTGDVKAEGGVRVFSLLKNTTLYADSMLYSSKSGKILSDSPVRQEKDDVVITGVGLEAACDLSETTILKDVKVVRKLK